MKTGMIIVNYNDAKTTINLLNEIKNYGCIDKILIVDDCSKDDSVKRLKEQENSKIKVLVSKENRGYGSAINIGIDYLVKELHDCTIIISNADIQIQKESDLKQLIKDIKPDDIGVVAPVILEGKSLNRGWKIPTPLIDCLLNLPRVNRYFRKKKLHYKEEYYQEKTSDVEAVSGCFFLIKSSNIENVPLFDPNIFLYYEENILAKKMQTLNKRVIIDNEIIVVHNHSVSIDKSLSKLKKFDAVHNSQYYFQVNYNNANLFSKLCLKVTTKISRVFLKVYYSIKK